MYAPSYAANRSKVKDSVSRSTSRGRSPHPPSHKSHYTPGPPHSQLGAGPMTHRQPWAGSSSRPMGPAHPSIVHRYSSPAGQPGVLGPPPVLVPGPFPVPLSQSHSLSKSPTPGKEWLRVDYSVFKHTCSCKFAVTSDVVFCRFSSRLTSTGRERG